MVDDGNETRNSQISQQWLDAALSNLLRSLNDIAYLIQNQTDGVDEYLPQQVTDATKSVTWQAQYAHELITGIIITGPANAAFTLELGDRYWSTLVMPSSGIMVISRIRLALKESDTRSLTTVTAGNWTVELTGHKINTLRYR